MIMSASRMTTQSTSSASLLYLSQWTIPAGLFIAGYLQKHKKKKKTYYFMFPFIQYEETPKGLQIFPE